jgi:hypothetical protein
MGGVQYFTQLQVGQLAHEFDAPNRKNAATRKPANQRTNQPVNQLTNQLTI